MRSEHCYIVKRAVNLKVKSHLKQVWCHIAGMTLPRVDGMLKLWLSPLLESKQCSG